MVVFRLLRRVSFVFLALLSLASKSRQHSAGQKGAVTSEVDVCSKVGTLLLRDGGNAADAAIGTTICIGVIAMYHSGIGGGGFINIRSAKGVYEIVDFRETAPAAAFQDMYINNTEASLYGGLAIGIPGELRALEYLHQKHGRLPWHHLFAPSIKIAREGFLVSRDLYRYMTMVTPSNEFLSKDPAWALDFAPNGTLLGIGDKMTRKRYANTLQTIAIEGPNAFYTGSIARTTIDAINKNGGIMTLKDLSNYTVTLRKPVAIEHKGYKLMSAPAPASGAVVLQALKILEGYPESSSLNSGLSTHRLDEAIKFGYGERTLFGDPAFVDNMISYQESMLNPKTALEIRRKISDFHTLNISAYNPARLENLDTPGTSQITVADISGLIISMTTTINTLFGSHVIVPETGVILNNEMNDFSIPGVSNDKGFQPSISNFVRPGKKPVSSMSPTIVEHCNGTFYAALGAGGGSRIITANIQNLWHILHHNLTAVEALAQPRFHDQLMPNLMAFEYAYDNSTVALLKSLGHNVSWVAPGQSYAQIIRRLGNGTFEAASEPRLADAEGLTI